jgi:hypothetical protein
MAVQSDTSSISYTGNNSTVTSYAVPFVFLENGHLQAIAKVTATGAETAVTLTNHTGAGDPNGGTVRTAVAVPATSTLTIFRIVPATQTTSYQEGGDFPAASHERALDKLTFLSQQNERSVERTFRVTEGSGIKNEVVAVPNTLLGLDASNQPKALTLSEVKTYLALSGVTLDVNAGMKTFADAGERALAVPDFTGQLGTQRDTGVVYVATGTSAGDWTVVSISDLSIVNADIASDAAIAGSKLADGAITNAKVDAAAAIAGTKIAPDFGSQNVVTTGNVFVNATSRTVGSTAAGSFQLETTVLGASIVNNRDDPTGAVLALGKSRGTTVGATTIVQAGDVLGQIRFAGADGVNLQSIGAQIEAQVDGTPSTNNMSGRLVFATTPSDSSTPTERMRITQEGASCFGVTSQIDASTGSATGTSINSGAVVMSRSANPPLRLRRLDSNGDILEFRRQTTVVGSISVTTTATAYNTSSDYRLKQNVEPMVGGLAKLAQLAPKTFEFINEPNVKVDGFIAHEVQAVVPQAVTGEKDGEEMQGLDHSKLVPVLVAAVQELSAKVEALEQQLEQP